VANGKTKVGPCWRSFIQGELSRGSHKSPDRVRNANSRNIIPVRQKLGRQEWNKSPGIRPSLPPFTKYIDAVVELSRQMSSCKDLVVEPSQLGSLNGLNGTRNTRVILVRPLTVKVKAYVQLRLY